MPLGTRTQHLSSGMGSASISAGSLVTDPSRMGPRPRVTSLRMTATDQDTAVGSPYTKTAGVTIESKASGDDGVEREGEGEGEGEDEGEVSETGASQSRDAEEEPSGEDEV